MYSGSFAYTVHDPRLFSLGTGITICICARPRLISGYEANHVQHRTIIYQVRSIFQVWLPTKQDLPRMPTNLISVTCAHAAGKEFCACHRGEKFIFSDVEIGFYHLPVLPRIPTNQMRVLPVHTQLARNFARVTGEKNSFLATWKLIFTTLEFYREY